MVTTGAEGGGLGGERTGGMLGGGAGGVEGEASTSHSKPSCSTQVSHGVPTNQHVSGRRKHSRTSTPAAMTPATCASSVGAPVRSA